MKPKVRARAMGSDGQLKLWALEVQGEGEAGTRAALEFFNRTIAAQSVIDELLERCWCGHNRGAHVRTDGSGPCAEKFCGCLRFGKEVG